MIVRSHDGFTEDADGVLHPNKGSKYASQQIVFDNLGKGVLNNAFEGELVFADELVFEGGILLEGWILLEGELVIKGGLA